MIEQLLEARLKPVWRRRWWLDLFWKLAACWAGSAALGTVILLGLRAAGWGSPLTMPTLLVVAGLATLWVILRHRRLRPNLQKIARDLEARDHRLDGRLTTALEQRPTAGASLNFLQHRLIVEAVESSFRDNWREHVSPARLVFALSTSIAALALFLGVITTLRTPFKAGTTGLLVRVSDLEVTPGDAELERGRSFVVLARFGGEIPTAAELVMQPSSAAPQTVPLTRSLSDPVFGGAVPEVTQDFVYHIKAGIRRSPEFKVRVFEFPRLNRADADLQFPGYTRLAAKRIEDTRRISAVEGTRLDLGLQLNKPVASARLLPRGTTNGILPLTIATNRAQVSLDAFTLEASGTYDLQLVDAEGRTNKMPAQFVFEVVVNRTPELKFVLPRGDQRPSALEEIAFEGSVWDDFGVLAYGLAYAKGEQEPVFHPLGTNLPPQERRTLKDQLRLEDLGVAPDDLVSWFLWADDLGPDGEIRRTRSDLFFGEVRPFDEIFREGPSGGGGEGQPQGQQTGSPTSKLAELQKEIINATWKLERQRVKARPLQHAQDVTVVTESQSQALDQARELGEDAADPRAEMMWSGVLTAMEHALTALVPATNATVSLSAARAAETAAYQALLKLREREFQVSRNRSQQGGGGGGGEQMRQQQLEQLELAEEANRYETQRDAQAPQGAERQEQLQVLSRLSELARRQEDLNERLKELQAQLQAADNEKEREEIRRQLKRLQEEQQQMLADADELQQRLNQPENQSRFAEQRKQLEQTRNELQRASEAAGQGSASQALAAGTRAQEQLQKMREEVQQESSSQFAQELREMRQEARALTRKQEEISGQLKALEDAKRRTLSASTERDALAEQLTRQQSRLTNLVANVTEISQAAEASEPIVSRQLYDTLRQLNQDESGVVKQVQEELIRKGQMTRGLYDRLEETQAGGEGKALGLMEDLVREGLLSQADDADQQARKTLARLQRGVEKAAESVLGDDTQALQRAQQELETLTSEIERELAQSAGSQPGRPGEPGSDPSAPAGPTPGQGTPSPGQPGQSPRQGQQPGQQPGQAQAGSPGQAGSGAGPSAANQGANAGPGQRRPADSAGADTGGRGTGPGGFDLATLESLGASSGSGRGGSGPLTGEDFAPWSDRLREVEEMIDEPGLRSQVATARERARLTRLEYKRELKKPDWAVVRLQVLKPLVEVQQQIREELRRRNPGDSLVPIDRDPVPARYAELVRRNYEQLGKDEANDSTVKPATSFE